jgi:hypothetical protein
MDQISYSLSDISKDSSILNHSLSKWIPELLNRDYTGWKKEYDGVLGGIKGSKMILYQKKI